MKNIMIIDGAINCAYDIFQATEEEFKEIFQKDDQDIAFSDDLNKKALNNLKEIWKRPVHKKMINGIHGTLFFDLSDKKEFYPNLKDTDLDFKSRAFSVQKTIGV